MTEEMLIQPLRFVLDVKSGLIQQPIRQQLMKNDRKANAVIVQMMDGREPMDLAGIAITGSFIAPPEGNEIPLTGSTEGSEATIILPDECYANAGYYELNMKMTIGGVARTVLSITGYVLSKGNGNIINVGNVIPSVEDIIAQYNAMKTVTAETMAARDQALEAAKSANFQVLGQYDTLLQLMVAHPTGNAGDAYAVGTQEPYTVYIWDVNSNSWKDIGTVQGAAGYTPVRGTDYWTEADKAEIKSYVDDAILGGEW